MRPVVDAVETGRAREGERRIVDAARQEPTKTRRRVIVEMWRPELRGR
jgi:hypothetical protein